MEAVIKTERLTKSYGSNRGIVEVDLEVRAGEVFGFLGPNGAGKTTMIRTLLDLLHPTGGRAYVFGMDSRARSVDIRARVGNLPGEYEVEPRMTGGELIEFYARLRGAKDLAYAHELAERLAADLHRPIGQLSRGNRQKIGLVQAMFHRPPLLILDEPTGGLDPLVQEEFLQIVSETRAEGRTVFFCSHVLSEVERVCDRVGIIREGRLVAVETTNSLFAKRYRHMRARLADEAAPDEFREVPGVMAASLDREGDLVMTVGSDLDAVIKQLARHTVVELELERPSLEEIFLTYYGEPEANGEESR